jgi:hypothetical protein
LEEEKLKNKGVKGAKSLAEEMDSPVFKFFSF